ncbi:uncharacterized protein LOC129231507 [Uloborus diversus]|uniref:uncharacterized protein LOC129231507 n=1 Tax=Uloborus diversus TaxID=327109 RepID=UPI0024096052|nr:uncharacterized protein LOC129231507 [Uloborus diversus]
MDNIIRNERPFKYELKDLCHLYKKLEICDEDVQNCVNEVYSSARSEFPLKDQNDSAFTLFFTSLCTIARLLFNILKYVLTCIFIVVFIYLFITSHNSVQKLILRNSQSFIYPVMRTLRMWTLPLLKRYEILSDWHEEECLVHNPFYYELPLDCWPCEDVRTLVDLTGFHNYSSDYVYNEQPFVVRDSIKRTVSFEKLRQIYKKHNVMLDRGTAKFLCSEKDFCSPKDVFNTLSPPKNSFQVMWKINRVAAARIVRKVFPRPYFIPNASEVALERYLYLSGAEASQFFLPLTDFANVWVAQGQGYRLIVLDPSEPCVMNCSTVSILLRPRDVLYYNWQFWRPRSRPANFSEDMSITYVGSFY